MARDSVSNNLFDTVRDMHLAQATSTECLLPDHAPVSINFNEEDSPNVTRERLLHVEKYPSQSPSTASGI